MHLVKPIFPIVGAVITMLSLPVAGTCRAQVAADPGEFQYQYKEIQNLEEKGKYDEALAKANAAVEANPKSIAPYVLRGHLYTEMSQWDKADADYRTILQIDPNNFPALFNRSEIKLTKKDYDGARDGFFALEKNPDWGDLAAYKVFVCDLLAGHELASRSELEAFGKGAPHASYYFANATWSFCRKKPDDAQSWIASADHIYPRKTIYFYSATLVALGYMKPLPVDLKAP
jgi:tetratricopeptide (TPR) repeat protein